MADKKISQLNTATTIYDADDLAVVQDGETKQANASTVKAYVNTGVVTLTGTQTLTNKTLTSPAISGGTANSLAIGGTTPAAGTFTTLETRSNVLFRQSSNSANTSVSLNTTVQNALTLDSSGRLGIGLSPEAKLDVVGSEVHRGAAGGVISRGSVSTTSTTSSISVTLTATLPISGTTWRAGVLKITAGRNRAYSGAYGAVEASYVFEYATSTPGGNARSFTLLGTNNTAGTVITITLTGTTTTEFTITASATDGTVPSTVPWQSLWLTAELHSDFRCIFA